MEIFNLRGVCACAEGRGGGSYGLQFSCVSVYMYIKGLKEDLDWMKREGKMVLRKDAVL